jgi:peptidyl-dipeptidase Dcp
MTNPLLDTWDTPFGLAPFERISDSDFAPAIEVAMAEDLAEVEALVANPDAPTFENTIEGLMQTGAKLDQVLGVFYNLAGADSNPAREEIMREFRPNWPRIRRRFTRTRRFLRGSRRFGSSGTRWTCRPNQPGF